MVNPVKRATKLGPKMLSNDNIREAIVTVNSTHRWLPGHKRNPTVQWVEEDIDARIVELRQIIIDGFVPYPMKKKRRWDKSAGKWRDVCEPRLWPDQYVHHILIQVLEPVFMRGMDRYCCGSIKKRGIHYGMKVMKKWMRGNPRDTKYCLELDIYHFYDSLTPKVVMDRLRQLVKDFKVLDLCERILSQGIAIGVYCSQWFANVVLQPLDHAIREMGFDVKRNLRYMDNFTIYASAKRKLRKVLAFIDGWLHDHELDVKGNWQIFPTTPSKKAIENAVKRGKSPKVRLPTALGYRYGHGYTLLRKRNLHRLSKQLNCYNYRKRHSRVISVRMAAGLMSRFGQLKHCNSHDVYTKVLNYQPKTQHSLKAIVRAKQKEDNLKWIEQSMCLGETA